MSQDIYSSIDPAISGTALATALDAFKNAVVSGFCGTTRPTELDAGGYWVDQTNDPTSWAFKIWTGTDDVTVFTVNLSTGLASVALAVDSFIVKKISADTVAAILQLVKQRVLTNGQVKSGDVVGEIRMVGRTNTSTDPVVAKIIFTSTDDNTTSAYGGTLSFYSTPDASATLTEHMRFINGLVETVLPAKVNALQLVGQNVATAATITQLNADQVLVELTGATTTDIQGIASTGKSQVVTIHNRSTAQVTFKHQNGTATAADRFKLPNSADFILTPESSITFYYCTTDARWKIKSTSQTVSGFSTDTYYGITQTWTAPSSTSAVKVRAYHRQNGVQMGMSGFMDIYGNIYSLGAGANGQNGNGDVTPRSSPALVVGGVQWYSRHMTSEATVGLQYGIDVRGNVWSWGYNANGQLGQATVTPLSSPAMFGSGFKFSKVVLKPENAFGITTAGVMYSMGYNADGGLGLGDVTPRSGPVVVLGSLRNVADVVTVGISGPSATYALTTAGVAYAWGKNTDGNLGLGDVASRSSPVAVLGGLTFSKIFAGSVSTRFFAAGLNTSGAAYAWGNNSKGQLGTADTTSRSSPVAVAGGLTFKRLFIHDKSETVFGITSAGVLYAWGDNTQGVLGVGDTTNRSSPVAVLGGLTFKDVFPFRSAVYAITADGTAYAWGTNSNGQLGVGDVVSRSSPVAVLGGLKFNKIVAADAADVYAIYGQLADGTIYSWGANANGTLGLGDVTPRSSPVIMTGSFSSDSSETITSIDLTVVGGTAYTITTGAGMASFGGNPIGSDIYKVEVEYLQ